MTNTNIVGKHCRVAFWGLNYANRLRHYHVISGGCDLRGRCHVDGNDLAISWRGFAHTAAHTAPTPLFPPVGSGARCVQVSIDPSRKCSRDEQRTRRRGRMWTYRRYATHAREGYKCVDRPGIPRRVGEKRRNASYFAGLVGNLGRCSAPITGAKQQATCRFREDY